ncbi:MAG: site-specific integrase, partial [Melioribacteraceae bacterium]|nr:site-specific integrase [Melioribacteraceae bacterium]
MLIDGIITNYLTELESLKRSSINTVSSYQIDLNQFYNFLNDREIESIKLITEKTLRNYLLFLNEQELSVTSISRKLSAIRGLLNYAQRNGYIESNPASRIKNPKIKRKLPEVLSVDSYLKIHTLLGEDKSGSSLLI